MEKGISLILFKTALLFADEFSYKLILVIKKVFQYLNTVRFQFFLMEYNHFISCLFMNIF